MNLSAPLITFFKDNAHECQRMPQANNRLSLKIGNITIDCEALLRIYLEKNLIPRGQMY